jgi:serine/threonine-protein kinase HipA
MERKVFVYVDLKEQPILVGTLWSRVRGKLESASFEHDRQWLKSPHKFSLEPALSLDRGVFHSRESSPLFGSIGDSAPDRWGRMLMRLAERKRSFALGERPRSLFELDYLLMVSDLSRQGALRFSEVVGGEFLANANAESIPPLIFLPKLLAATDSLAEERESEEEFKLLFNPGSSLGGARPKASVRDGKGNLLIAKFPQKEDEYNLVVWEAIALSLAAKAKINVSNWRLEKIKNKSILLLERFDRLKSQRIPFISAMSMLEARDNEQRSYLEIVDVIRQYGAKPKIDIAELWRRMVFNVLISNTDDHLRNHGFLYQDSEGWRLSPAYDLNPVPQEIKPRVLSTSINENEATASIELALEVASYFDLNLKEARKIIREIAKITVTWQEQAKLFGVSKSAAERLASAFEHEDLKRSL